MKEAIMLLMAIALIPCSFAQQSLYREVVFVFTVDQGSVIPDEGECAVGLNQIAKRFSVTGINPTVAGKLKINTFTTSGNNAKVNGQGDEEVGELLVCQDWQTYVPETNLVPIYYEVRIGGRKFRVMGGGIHPLFPDILPGGLQVMAQLGYPATDVLPVAISGTVLSSGEPGSRGGIYSTNFILDLSNPDDPDDRWKTNSQHVLRVLLPADN